MLQQKAFQREWLAVWRRIAAARKSASAPEADKGPEVYQITTNLRAWKSW